MSALLHKRLAKIEEALKPVPELRIRILVEPDQDASPESQAAHIQELDEAKAEADRVFLVTSRPPEFKRRTDGVELYATELEAQLALMAAQRSDRGNQDRLADLLEDISGNVMGTVDDPRPGRAW